MRGTDHGRKPSSRSRALRPPRAGGRLPILFSLLVASILNGCQADIASGLDEARADEVLLALDSAGIGAEKAHEDASSDPATYRVVVASEDVATGLAALRELDLPRRPAPGFAELFDGSGLIPSATEERARFASATSGELARSLESMDDVTRARVHISLPPAGGRLLDDEPAHARASVLIQHRAGAHVDEQAVRALVAGAVSDLAEEDVAVVSSGRRARPRAAARLAYVGPIAVSRGSATTLKALFAGSFALNLILAVTLVLSRRRVASRGSRSPAPGEARPTES